MPRIPSHVVREPVAEYEVLDPRLEGLGRALDRLIAQGRIKPATSRLVDLGYPPEAPQTISISDALNDQRAER